MSRQIFLLKDDDFYADNEATKSLSELAAYDTDEYPSVFVKFTPVHRFDAMVFKELFRTDKRKTDLNYISKIKVIHDWQTSSEYVEVEYSDTPLRDKPYEYYCNSAFVYEFSTDFKEYKKIGNSLVNCYEKERYWCGIPCKGDNFNYCVSIDLHKNVLSCRGEFG